MSELRLIGKRTPGIELGAF